MADSKTPSYEELMREGTPVAPETPSYSDLMAAAVSPSKENPTKAESALVGAEQGMTFGFAPQLSTAIPLALNAMQGKESLTEKNKKLKEEGVKGDVGPTSTLELYRQLRDQKAKELQQAAAANPTSNLAGTALGGLLTGGAVNSMATAGIPMAQAAATILNPAKAMQSSGLLAKTAAQAASGAGIGALYNVASAPEDLTQVNNPIQTAGSQVLSGAIPGAALGAALPIAGAAASGLAGFAGELPSIKKISDAFKYGKAGETVTNPLQIAGETDTVANKTLGKLNDAVKNSTQQRNDLITAADQQVKDTGILKTLQDIKKSIYDVKDYTNPDAVQKKAELLNMIDDLTSGKAVFTPSEATNVIDKIRDFTPAGEGSFDKGPMRDLQKAMTSGVKNLTQQVSETVPGFADQQAKISDLLTMRDYLTGKNSNRFKSANQNQDLVDSVRKYIRNYSSNPDTQIEINKMLNEGMSDPYTGRQTPPLSELDPSTADYMQQTIPNVSRRAELAGVAEQTMKGGDIKSTIKGSSPGLAVRLAEKGGQVTGALKSDAQAAKDFVTGGLNDLAKKDPTQLVQKAQDGMNIIGDDFAKYAKGLADASTKGAAAKNAALFNMMQQPEFRRHMRTIDETKEGAQALEANPNAPQGE